MTLGRRALLLCLLATLVGSSVFGEATWAFWTATVTPGSNGASLTASLNQVPTPSAAATGRSISVSWAASTLSNGTAVGGYVVKRYDAATLSQQTVGPGCAGTLVLPSCAEAGVPAGQWVYSVTPVLATNWRGQESVKSSPVTVAAPTLALSSTRVRPGASLAGTVSGFIAGETLHFRLDGPAGAELTGTLAGSATPSAVPDSGGGAVTVVMPSGTNEGTHTVYAVASPTGNTATAEVVVDGTAPPAPALTQTPTNPSGDSATFAFTESEASATLDCSLDSAAYSACESPLNYTGLASGAHTFRVRATDIVGNISVVTSYTWTVNLTIPAVNIGFPAMGGSYNDAGFTTGCGTIAAGDVCGSAEDDLAVTAGDVSLRQLSTGLYWNGLSFSSSTETWLAVQLTGSDWTYAIGSSSLPEGDYTLRARASDGVNLGNDARAFTVDRTVPPVPTFTVPPPTTSAASVSIQFATGDQGAVVECRLDGAAWASCTSPKRYDTLTDGTHTVDVRAVDRAGNTSGVASRTWTVDAGAPAAALSFPASGIYNHTSWAVGCGTPTGDLCGTAGDARSGLATVAVSIHRAASNSYWDGTAFAASSETWQPANGTTSWAYPFDATSFPADGAYTVRWRATDNVGNSTVGGIGLTVDTTAPPEPIIVQAPHDPSGPAAQFDFTIGEAGGALSQCRLDLGDWVACAAPVSYGGLAPGSHTFAVRATDAAGNLSAATSHSWTVDDGIPVVQLSAPASGRTYNDTGYNAGCGTPTGDICGTASDPQGNLATVDLSIQQASTQLYWDGSTFSSPTEVHQPVSGAASWSYAMPAAAFASNDSFTARARATDGAGLTAVDSVTISFDRTAPAVPVITSGPTGTTAGGDTFTFTGESDDRFECQLDSAPWATCTSPNTSGSLTDGSHTFAVRAVDAAGNTGPATSRTWSVDATAPNITTTFPATGGRYNNATYDAGCVAGTGDLCGTTSDPASGVAKVELSLQRASTGLYLSGTTFGSATQNWITASGSTSWSLPLAATTFPADGTYTLTVRATDTVGNARTTSTAYVVDRTKPTAAGFTTTNATGGTVRKLDQGDRFTLNFSEPIAAGSILPGWNGSTSQNVMVRATGNGGSKDRLTVYNAANTTQLPLGTVNLNRTDYVTGAVTFGTLATPSTLTMSGSTLTITLGTPSNSTRITTATATANASWTPSSSVLDLAGNAATTTIYTEGDNDNDF